MTFSPLIIHTFILAIWPLGVVLSEEKQLIMAQIIFRHSNRTPIYIYKNSPCQLPYYKDGMGAITNEGLKYAYRFGKKLRTRYIEEKRLLDGNYFKEIYVRSSDVDRCIQTAQTILSSLYEPKGSVYEWNDNLNWFPMPIHTRPGSEDEVLRSEASYCPKLVDILNERMTTGRIKSYFATHALFFDKISDLVGETVNPDTIWDIYQTLQIEFWDNQIENSSCGHIPSWLTAELLSTLEELTYEVLNIYYDPTPHNPEEEDYAKLLGGPLLSEIISNMNTSQSDRRTKLYMYSAHDNTIYHLLGVLGIRWDGYIQYLTSIIFEVYKLHSNEYILETYFHDGKNTIVPFAKIELPRCPEPCHLESFLSAYDDMRSLDRKVECHYVYQEDSCKI